MPTRSMSAAAITVFMLAVPAFSFSLPQLFWPQKDIDSSSVNSSTLAKKVLIASRDSGYKRALVANIKEALKNDSVYVKWVGLMQLKNEDASAYGAIVLINTCMAWDWDRNVNAFLKRKKGAGNVIVLTTSGSGKWLPKRNPAGVDAIAGASSKPDPAAADIVGRIRNLLLRQDSTSIGQTVSRKHLCREPISLP